MKDFRKKKKGPATITVAVKLPVGLNSAIHNRCERDGMLKRHFVELACRKLLEATNA